MGFVDIICQPTRENFKTIYGKLIIKLHGIYISSNTKAIKYGQLCLQSQSIQFRIFSDREFEFNYVEWVLLQLSLSSKWGASILNIWLYYILHCKDQFPSFASFASSYQMSCDLPMVYNIVSKYLTMGFTKNFPKKFRFSISSFQMSWVVRKVKLSVL